MELLKLCATYFIVEFLFIALFFAFCKDRDTVKAQFKLSSALTIGCILGDIFGCVFLHKIMGFDDYSFQFYEKASVAVIINIVSLILRYMLKNKSDM